MRPSGTATRSRRIERLRSSGPGGGGGGASAKCRSKYCRTGLDVPVRLPSQTTSFRKTSNNPTCCAAREIFQIPSLREYLHANNKVETTSRRCLHLISFATHPNFPAGSLDAWGFRTPPARRPGGIVNGGSPAPASARRVEGKTEVGLLTLGGVGEGLPRRFGTKNNTMSLSLGLHRDAIQTAV